MKRSLTLKAEHLSDLTPEQLAGVAGAQQALPTIPLDVCTNTMQATRCFCP